MSTRKNPGPQRPSRRALLGMAGASLAGAALLGRTGVADDSLQAKDQQGEDYVFPLPPPVSLAIAGSDKRFPVRRIYCVGMNYPREPELLAQAPSLGDLPENALVLFDKHRDSLTEDGADIPYPQGTTSLIHEVELVVAIGSTAVEVSEERALEHVFGYAIGNDLTRRDPIKPGGPVDAGKSFDHSAPCGSIYPVSAYGHVKNARLRITVDGEARQEGNTGDMIRGPARLVAELSQLFHLQPGDLIYTGTPGVPGEIAPGQTMVCAIDGLGTLTNRMVQA